MMATILVKSICILIKDADKHIVEHSVYVLIISIKENFYRKDTAYL